MFGRFRMIICGQSLSILFSISSIFLRAKTKITIINIQKRNIQSSKSMELEEEVYLGSRSSLEGRRFESEESR